MEQSVEVADIVKYFFIEPIRADSFREVQRPVAGKNPADGSVAVSILVVSAAFSCGPNK